jgi:acyl carrier protein
MKLFEMLGGERARKHRLEAAFSGREPLDDLSLWELHFRDHGVSADTVSRVRKVLSEVLGADLSRIRDTDDFSKNLKFFWDFDSLADVQAVQGLESEFGIRISDPDAERMRTLKDIILGVHEKLQSPNG